MDYLIMKVVDEYTNTTPTTINDLFGVLNTFSR